MILNVHSRREYIWNLFRTLGDYSSVTLFHMIDIILRDLYILTSVVDQPTPRSHSSLCVVFKITPTFRSVSTRVGGLLCCTIMVVARRADHMAAVFRHDSHSTTPRTKCWVECTQIESRCEQYSLDQYYLIVGNYTKHQRSHERGRMDYYSLALYL
jgi:hypothetical protein